MKYIGLKNDTAVFFNSQSKFCDNYNLKQGAVSKCITGLLKSTGGWMFRKLPKGYDFVEFEEHIFSEMGLDELFENSWYTINEFADKKNVCRKTVENWMKSGVINYDKISAKDVRIYDEVKKSGKFSACNKKLDISFNFHSKDKFEKTYNISILDINKCLTGDILAVQGWKFKLL